MNKNNGRFLHASFNPLTQPTTVDYIVVAGGGGGGGTGVSKGNGFGAGAGGLLQGYNYPIVQGVTYSIAIGAGGAGGLGTAAGTQGSSSSWNTTALGGGSTICTTGGGYGGATGINGGNGGSGGAGGNSFAGTGIAGQGYGAGPSFYGAPPGGGGGAGGYGGYGGVTSAYTYSATYQGAPGGPGLYVFDGNVYAGGGGTGGSNALAAIPYLGPQGGIGGGGSGGRATGYNLSACSAGGNGCQSTGGGGGGSGGPYGYITSRRLAGGHGGSGIVILRTLASVTPAVSTTGYPIIYLNGAYRYYKFTANGTITF